MHATPTNRMYIAGLYFLYLYYNFMRYLRGKTYYKFYDNLKYWNRFHTIPYYNL